MKRRVRTCVQFPPVELAEERMGAQLVARAVLEAQSLVHLFRQQTLADGLGVLAELLRVGRRLVQDPLLHLFVLHLSDTNNPEQQSL